MYDLAMCCHVTLSGEILPVWTRNRHDEVMVSCARIGFKP
jgi:hypothetical protein